MNCWVYIQQLKQQPRDVRTAPLNPNTWPSQVPTKNSKFSHHLAEDQFSSSMQLLRLQNHGTAAGSLPCKEHFGRGTSSPLLPCITVGKAAHQPHKSLCKVQPRGLEGTLGPLKSILYTGDGDTAWIMILFRAHCCVDCTALVILGDTH